MNADDKRLDKTLKEIKDRMERVTALIHEAKEQMTLLERLEAKVIRPKEEEPKSQFMKIANALLQKGNNPQSARWIMNATGISRSALSQVIHRTHKQAFISVNIPGYSKMKLWALTKEAADELTQQLRHNRQQTLFGDDDPGREFAGRKATDCCAIILEESENTPMSALTLARESLSRGYVGEPHGTEDEKLLRTAKSFWAAMGRDERFAEVRPLVFALKEKPQKT